MMGYPWTDLFQRVAQKSAHVQHFVGYLVRSGQNPSTSCRCSRYPLAWQARFVMS